MSQTRNSATAEIARNVRNGHSRSFKVICRCARGRSIYDFLLALNSNLTYIFNRSSDITPSLNIHLSSRWNWKKMAGSRWTCFGIRVPRTLAYPTMNLNPRQSAPYDHNARPSHTDRQTDERHGNSVTIHSNEHIVC